MPTSKLFLWIFLVLNLSVLMACNIPSPQARNDAEGTESATFFVTEAKGDSLGTKLSKDFAIPNSKTFNFSVCVKDQVQSKPLVGHPFHIGEIEKDLKTDEKGCLNWTEEVPFNFFSEPKYLEWKREVTATGLHKGSRVVRFAINPWNDTDKSQAVVNLNNTTPPQLIKDSEEVKAALAGQSKGSTEIKNTLWVNDVRIQSNEQKFTSDGVMINMELMAVPQLQILTLNGEKVLRSLTQGRFKTKIYLIHSIVENNDEKHRVLAESLQETMEVHNNSLFINAPLKLTSIPTRGQLILGLDITAEGGNESIGNFQGVYLIGDYDQIKISGFLKLMKVVTQRSDFKLSDFINAQLEEKLAANSENKDGYVKPRIEITPLDISFLRVGKETTSERQVIYTVKACFKNGIEQKITRGYVFNVSGFRQGDQAPASTLKTSVDNTGCIYWDESISFKYYECHKSLIGTIEIESKELALKEKIRVALNPWDPLLKGRDLRLPHNEDYVITDCKKENVLPSTLTLRSFSYSTLSYMYEIDSLLNLSLKKKLRFKLDAAVSEFSDMTFGRMQGPQKLRPGVYLLKLALIKNRDYYNQKTYVASTERLVSTLDGDIKADIELKTVDLKALGERNTLLVELNPVQESKVTVDKDGNVTPKVQVASFDELIGTSTGLYNRTFSAPMTLNTDRDSHELTALDLTMANQYLVSANLPKTTENKSVVREYIKFGERISAENHQAQKAQSDIGLFVKKNSLKLISVANAHSFTDLRAILSSAPTKMSDTQMAQELKQFATTGTLNKELTKGLCSYWFRSYIKKDLWDLYGENALINCGLRAHHPERLFTIEKRLFVKELGGYDFVKGFNQGVTVGNNITLSKSHAKSNYATKSVNFSMGITQRFADVFSIGMSGSYAIAQSVADAATSSNSALVTTNISLVMQQNNFQLKFNRYQECGIVKINPKLFLKKGLFDSAINPAYNEDQQADVASKGLMICTGQDNTNPITRTENYYFLAQDVSNTQMQDSGDDRNRNFFIALRGEKELNRLMYFMRGAIKPPDTADRETDEQKNTLTTLDGLFKTGTTNIPGAYNDTRP